MSRELSIREIILELKLNSFDYRVSKNSILNKKGIEIGEIDLNKKINIYYTEKEIEEIIRFKKFLREENIPYEEKEQTKISTLEVFKKKADYYQDLIKKIEE